MLNLSQRFLLFLIIIIIINLILIFTVNGQNVQYDFVQNIESIDYNVNDGSDMDTRKFYFITAIIYRVTSYSSNTADILGCVGSLLTPKNILTTANCVVNHHSRDIYVRAGSLEWYNGGYTSDVHKIIIHERFDNITLNYDIAYLYLSKDGFENAIQKTTLIRLIQLPEQSVKDDMIALESGWGTSNITNVFSNILTQSTVTIMSYSKCRKILNEKMTRQMICGKGIISDESYCFGSTGGPLINYNYTLIGILSKGESCKGDKNPGVYTDIYDLLYWIRNELQKSNKEAKQKFRLLSNRTKKNSSTTKSTNRKLN